VWPRDFFARFSRLITPLAYSFPRLFSFLRRPFQRIAKGNLDDRIRGVFRVVSVILRVSTTVYRWRFHWYYLPMFWECDFDARCALNQICGVGRHVNGLPSGFTEAVIAALVKMAFWRSQEALDLEKTIRLRGGELAEVWSSLQSALELFWQHAPTALTEIGLDLLRQRKIVGGGVQDWVDDEELADFMASLRHVSESADNR
jgi:hypothetical protein